EASVDPLELTDQQISSLFQIYLKRLIQQILEKYSSTQPFFSAINQYITIANKWGATERLDWARQEAAAALNFYHELQGTGVEYKELADLSLSFVGSMDATANNQLFQYIHFLHSLLKEKNRKSALNQGEQRLF